MDQTGRLAPDQPDASVIIPTYHGAERLPIVLAALARQTALGRFEVVVAVDGDEDHSALAATSCDAAALLDLQLVVLTHNEGRPSALNAGFAAARGRVLIRCDDDLVPSPDFVERHIAHHVDNGLAVIGLYRNVFVDNPYSKSWGRRASELFNESAVSAPSEIRWRYWAGNCSVTRKLFDRVGGYDTSFRSYGFEDADWGYRASTSGAHFLIDPGLETEHRVPSTTTAERSKRAFMSGRASTRFIAKHGEVLPHASPSARVTDLLWSVLVWGGSFATSADRARRRGESVDRLIERLDPRLVRRPGWGAKRVRA